MEEKSRIIRYANADRKSRIEGNSTKEGKIPEPNPKRKSQTVNDRIPQHQKLVMEKLRKLRLEKNISLETMAYETGLGKKIVQRMEVGEKSPRMDHLTLVAMYLGVELSDVMESAWEEMRQAGADTEGKEAGNGDPDDG